jgi:predicted nucleic acid-binding protein
MVSRAGDVKLVRNPLIDGILVLARASVVELLSDPEIEPPIEGSLLEVPQLEATSGYWERVGKLRTRLMSHRFRPKLVDSLIAQSCLDHDVMLTTRDRDFFPFQKLAGLRLVAHDMSQ